MIPELQNDTQELTAEEAQALLDMGVTVYFDADQAKEELKALQEFNM
jgi:hypothetical protein